MFYRFALAFALAGLLPSTAWSMPAGSLMSPVRPVVTWGAASIHRAAVDDLLGAAPGLDVAVADRAQLAVECARAHGERVDTLLIVDMGRHALERRLWAMDLRRAEAPRLVLHERVAHGAGSDQDGDGLPERFSDTPNSHMTSLGLYRVAERYHGANGWSRRLDGFFRGMNGRARERAVVMHPSTYVSAAHVGRSQGCPAVSQSTMDALERAGLRNAVLWIDGPDPRLAAEVAVCAASGVASQVQSLAWTTIHPQPSDSWLAGP